MKNRSRAKSGLRQILNIHQPCEENLQIIADTAKKKTKISINNMAYLS